VSPRWLLFEPGSVAASDWDTYELGASWTTGYGNVQYTPNYDSAYPLHSGVYEPRLGFSGYGNQATARFANYTNRLAMPAYAAIWITPAEAAAGTFGEADNSGWYVFQKDADPNPGGNGSQKYTPIACPTGGGDTGSGLGLFNNGGAYNVARLNLSNYTDSTGEGGTDHWSRPPFSVWDPRQDITYTLTNSSWTSMGVSSSGDAILKDVTFSWPPGYWSSASSNTLPRFVLGSYTSGYTGAQVDTLWLSLRIEYSINGGTIQTLGAPVSISSNQTSYINSGNSLNNSSALGSGDTVRYFVSDI